MYFGKDCSPYRVKLAWLVCGRMWLVDLYCFQHYMYIVTVTTNEMLYSIQEKYSQVRKICDCIHFTLLLESHNNSIVCKGQYYELATRCRCNQKDLDWTYCFFELATSITPKRRILREKRSLRDVNAILQQIIA